MGKSHEKREPSKDAIFETHSLHIFSNGLDSFVRPGISRFMQPLKQISAFWEHLELGPVSSLFLHLFHIFHVILKEF